MNPADAGEDAGAGLDMLGLGGVKGREVQKWFSQPGAEEGRRRGRYLWRWASWRATGGFQAHLASQRLFRSCVKRVQPTSLAPATAAFSGCPSLAWFSGIGVAPLLLSSLTPYWSLGSVRGQCVMYIARSSQTGQRNILSIKAPDCRYIRSSLAAGEHDIV